jgi:hypothetical protein
MDAGGECCEIAQDRIMSDRAVQIDVNMPADPDIRSNDVAGADDAPVADLNPFGHFDTRVDESRETKPCLLRSSDHFRAARWVADGGDDLRSRVAETCFGQAQNRDAVNVFPRGEVEIVNETTHRNRFGFGRAPLSEPCDFPRETAGAINQYLGQPHNPFAT